MIRLILRIPAAWFVGLVLLLSFLASFMICAQCHAADLELSAGVAVVRGEAAAGDLSMLWPSRVREGDYWKASASVIGASTWAGQSAPTNPIVRGVYLTSFGHLQAGIGLAVMAHDLPYDGSAWNFDLEASYRPASIPIVLSFVHMSNAGIRLPNYGRNLLLLGYRF